jgi:hypothetical protein
MGHARCSSRCQYTQLCAPSPYRSTATLAPTWRRSWTNFLFSALIEDSMESGRCHRLGETAVYVERLTGGSEELRRLT